MAQSRLHLLESLSPEGWSCLLDDHQGHRDERKVDQGPEVIGRVAESCERIRRRAILEQAVDIERPVWKEECECFIERREPHGYGQGSIPLSFSPGHEEHLGSSCPDNSKWVDWGTASETD